MVIAALSDKEKVERVIIQTAAHEVGHTLGLRHNFKGSLMPPSSSVMDYMSTEGKAASPRPGPYDVAAIRYLYNLSEALPTEPFCTDGGNAADPLCTQRDFGADPLNDFHLHAYVTALDDFMAMGLARDRARVEAATTSLMFFVRAGLTPEQRMAAWRIATERVRAAVPLSMQPGPGRPGGAHARDPPVPRPAGPRGRRAPPRPAAAGASSWPPFPADAMLSTEVAGELKANLLATAPLRTPTTRRASVTGLKRMQTLEAYRALREARDQLAAGQAVLMGDEQLIVQDLIIRIDEALTPYFD